MTNPDMLAFTYRIQKIMRDMKYTHQPDEESMAKRDAVIESLREVCARIEKEFS